MNTPWAELPNSHHIDWVIASLKTNPKIWTEAQAAVARVGARDADAVAELVAQALVEIAMHGMLRYSAWESARDAAMNARLDVPLDVLTALIAYDDCDQYLNMSYEKLQVYASLSEKPQAVLLLPIVYVREKVNETEIY